MGIEQGFAHDVEKRQNYHLDVVSGELEVAADGVGVAGDVGMGKHHAFGPAGGAGGVDD